MSLIRMSLCKCGLKYRPQKIFVEDEIGRDRLKVFVLYDALLTHRNGIASNDSDSGVFDL